MPRPGKTRKEIYFSRQEMELINNCHKLTGLDKTNTIRLLINLGFSVFSNSTDFRINKKPLFKHLTKKEVPEKSKLTGLSKSYL